MKEVDRKMQAHSTGVNIEELLRVIVVGCLLVWLLFFLFGCGSPEVEPQREIVYDDRGRVVDVLRLDPFGRAIEPYAELWEESELGALEQPYSAKYTNDYQLGVQSGASRLQCNRSNTSQLCSILRGIGMGSPRTVTYYIDEDSFGPPGNVFNNEVWKMVEDLDTALGSGWTFNEVTDTDPWPTLYFNDLPCSGSSSSTSISAFSCVNLEQTGENLLEGVGVIGSYTTHDSAIVHLDMADIQARGANQLQELYLTRHAAGHGAGAGISLGGRLDAAASDFVSRMAVDVNWSGAAASQGEVCRANSLSGIGDGQFTQTSKCSGAN